MVLPRSPTRYRTRSFIIVLAPPVEADAPQSAVRVTLYPQVSLGAEVELGQARIKGRIRTCVRSGVRLVQKSKLPPGICTRGFSWARYRVVQHRRIWAMLDG
jgi:hypothetical protein